ncbi:MAG: thioredoxin family protein [Anaeroplasmataceae bacterium]
MIIHITKNNFKEVLENNPKILVDFWASWCSPCRMLGTVLEELKDEMVIGKINVDEEPELSMAFDVQTIPLVLLFKDGKVVNKINGYVPASVIKEFYNE